LNPLASLIAERIHRFGPITFAEYMRECLYHPVHGYYSQPEARRFADYYTSVDVHPIFGRLLARQFAEMWEQMGRPAEFVLVEAGAGPGRLARQILEFARTALPELYEAVRYVAVERSPGRCDQIAATLQGFVREGKCQASVEIPGRVNAGCVFSNELLDALPVHRVVQQDGKLQEIFVTVQGESFAEMVAPLSTCALGEYFATQQITLQEGQHAEASLECCDWIMEIARRLERGFVLSVDYGHMAGDLFDEHHMAGTVLAYRNHHYSQLVTRQFWLALSFFRAVPGDYHRPIIADATNDSLDQPVNTLVLGVVHHVKSKLGLAFCTLTYSNRQRPAKIILNERRLVTRLLRIPGENPLRREIASLPFRPLRSYHQILRMFARGITHPVQFEPGDGANVRSTRSFAHRIRHIQRNKPRHYPSCNRNRLIPRLRGIHHAKQFHEPKTNLPFCSPPEPRQTLFHPSLAPSPQSYAPESPPACRG